MSLGLYFHIPYCLQKCHYCDFVTFSLDHEIQMNRYTELLITELRARAKYFLPAQVQSIYFGGGTPSLLPASHILNLRDEINRLGFEVLPDAEITIEINPGTIDNEKLDLYLAAGINRFSVGVQTFNAAFLKHSGREHSAQDSRDALQFLKDHNLNYSFDLLFGLPDQTLNTLELDLKELIGYNPNHVSIYNLTVPKKHFMNLNRASDEVQSEMFQVIDKSLAQIDVFRYELSNFSKEGFESKHNKIYWSDQAYWGLGVAAHSYIPNYKPWGVRFCNPSSYKQYVTQVEVQHAEDKPFFLDFAKQQVENLLLHEALTDYCHTQLRMMRGLNSLSLQAKFGQKIYFQVLTRLNDLKSKNLLEYAGESFRLSPSGRTLANQVFLALTFLPEDLNISTR
ncbi:MAG: radical SAM family heme chaperone HemW [Bdellovibrionales bacterium]